MNDTELEAFGRELKDRAFGSIGVIVMGVGAAAIPFAGAFLVLFVGWIPLLVWVLRGIDPFFLALQSGRRDLVMLAGFSVAAPCVAYALPLWILAH